MDIAIFKAIIMGILQGATEFLPVSSTAHLILFPWFLGWEGEIDTLTFNVAVHGGTLLALLICFYRDWLNLFKDRRLLYLLTIATIPTVTIGIIFYDVIAQALRNPLLIAFTTAVFGALMLVAERYGKMDKGKVSMKDSIAIGLSQAIALVPGVSRSGITITAGLFRDLTRESAARFSFLMATPITSGVVILEGSRLLRSPECYSLDIFAAGFVAAFISGFFAIKFLLVFFKKYPLHIFAYYRFLLAGIIVIGYIGK
ncbi:undecaprenyl-diphosphate phosphatase [Thermodesulfovibrionales bacterium]|nr:undecaprenyl-diphosphate phosphatase [Thermodesulfovibrionales bacterium]MCL0074630.1 undecaprenyl-diphosphate phosphatase [Thermodesulfovibrionales bacterium]